jgi:nucleoside-diphosphate-sugar epimerase
MDNKFRHIILGAGGAIGNVLTEELLTKGENVRLVSRREHKIDGTESASADLTDNDSTVAVIDESAIVYLLVGLPYDRSIWREQWPRIMENVIEACRRKNAGLIFFDNVYMYGRVKGKMTENSPIKPISEKGKIRAEIANRLILEMNDGNIKAIIARAADFYGPHADGASLPYIFYFSRLAAGRKARVLVNAKTRHSYTYTGDCGKALYLLSKEDSAYNQVWHLPTMSPALTDEDFIEIAARKLGVKPKYSILGKWMVKLAGMFDKQTGEVYEMLYQNEFDYEFDSSKFERFFNFRPTPYEKGIEETIEFYRQKGQI